ncbi:hypothetical protein GGR54DRAFT_440678 [Hypoxylon sp. NC1633]|nr:hypothetical protein GGR54DRAFT_440678 [Hypoxylon sp. NC1633]
MGRTESSTGRPPAGFRRDARAKRNKTTANKVIPAMLTAHPRARKGVEASELIVDPMPTPRPAGPRGTAATGKAAKGEGGSSSDGLRPRVSLCVADTLEAAYSLLLVPTSASSTLPPDQKQELRRDRSNKVARVGVLNMASPLSAGGGFLIGAQGQEEASLCPRTTLFPALRDEFYRLPELGVVLTPDVLVFRGPFSSRASNCKSRKRNPKKTGEADDEAETVMEGDEAKYGEHVDGDAVLPKPERWFVDVASAAMLRLPEIEVDAESGWTRYANPVDREMAIRKMRALMRVFSSKGVKKVVLGAWGCGAYANPVREIASAWRKVLLGGGKESGKGTQGREKKGRGERVTESWGVVEHVVFAIKDAGMAQAFAMAFGTDLLEECGDDEDDISEDGEEDDEDEKVKELRDKIQEVELRIEQARTPQLKAGLNSVLAGLRNE